MHRLVLALILAASPAPVDGASEHLVCGSPFPDDEVSSYDRAPGRGWPSERIDSPHFRVYYEPTGEFATPLERAVTIVEDLEQAYAFFVDDPRFRMRLPNGGGEVGSAGVPLIECGAQLLNGYYGLSRSFLVAGSKCEWGAGAYILVHSGLPRDLQRFASAHEVYHVFQAANDIEEGDFFHESTADWAADHAWPDEPYPLGRTFQFLREPHYALFARGTSVLRLYGASIFWRFIDTRWPPAPGERSVATEVWNRSCQEVWLDAFEEQMSTRGYSFLQVLHEFAIWNQHSGEYDDGHHYPAGGREGNVNVQSWIDTYPSLDVSLEVDKRARWTGSNHLRFEGKASRRTLRVRLEGDPRVNEYRLVTLLATTRPSTHVQFETRGPDPSGAVEYVVDDWHRFDVLHLIVTNGRSADPLPAEVLEYGFSAAEEGDPVTDVAWTTSPRVVENAPDPFVSATFVRFIVADGTNPTRVFVVDAAGRRVASLLNEHLAAGTYNRAWYGQDDGGRAVASGVYFVVVENGARRDAERVVRIR